MFVMRYKTWVNRFSADPKILNTTFVLNGRAADFDWRDAAAVWLGRCRRVDTRKAGSRSDN